ncbi:MAG: hypothetical protein CM1200mP22_28740 [Dehalococcoidia bacterium]|nr:MAG: hypothetical protein CM1200mP22_28740 [Dehalococcoidia bacterium]
MTSEETSDTTGLDVVIVGAGGERRICPAPSS